MAIYVNGDLSISKFVLQEQQSGQWLRPTDLLVDHKYRFVVSVENNVGNPNDYNLKVTDLFNPFIVAMLPKGKKILYGRIKVSISGPAAGLSFYRFYPDPQFTGPWTPAGSAMTDSPLARGESRNLYIHFQWASGPYHLAGVWPSSYMPQVTMTARQIILSELPPGPIANLQPVC